MITLLVMTDGRRDCIAETIPSALASLSGPITDRVIHDDSGDPDYRAWLADQFPTFTLIGAQSGRSGFGGAIASAWAWLVANSSTQFVFHLEDDFIFNRIVNLEAMADVLVRHSHITQMALRRQPWNDDERAAGGIVEQHPDDYREVAGLHGYPVGDHLAWLEHRRFFTTNPSLYRTELCRRGWPTASNSEGRFSIDLFAHDPLLRSGFWGARDSGEWVTHIGRDRVGSGY